MLYTLVSKVINHYRLHTCIWQTTSSNVNIMILVLVPYLLLTFYIKINHTERLQSSFHAEGMRVLLIEFFALTENCCCRDKVLLEPNLPEAVVKSLRPL